MATTHLEKALKLLVHAINNTSYIMGNEKERDSKRETVLPKKGRGLVRFSLLFQNHDISKFIKKSKKNQKIKFSKNLIREIST